MTRSSEGTQPRGVAGFREGSWDAAAALIAENLRRCLAGEAVANIVDKRAGY